MNLMALLGELGDSMMILLTKPFSLLKRSCIFVVRSFCIVVCTWVELLRAAINIHVDIITRFMIWTFALITLPVRVLAALQRERLLQIHLHALQIELDNREWNQKQLEERLHMAIKECRMMEAMLEEVEDEHDEAIVKIEILERQLQGIKEENLQLKEIQGKGRWSLRSEDDAGKGNDHGSTVADNCKRKTESLDFIRTEMKAREDTHEVTTGFITRNLYMDEVLVQKRKIAVLQSLFSAVLSLVVGVIIWEAEDPCMPLVVALFTVVGMSLRSVRQFFSTVNNKPVSDAVALLSFNCFILGTLSYPTLPRIAHMSTPMALSFLERTASWLGFTS
ncbi:hypothetical protein Vadar_016184 [Vaccinium darrowii]|uniref:Uncharacterized protein n=1 Tax=Vaccinium darrowii TaxID=229202 RepID=A0ACB7YP86_9ERIC|nr:hypothetical protein Vadar_016184 [Vaccinium darrowii]